MTTATPYIPHQPGDLITAEDWNTMQVDVRQDIGQQIATSIASLKDVEHSTNSDQIGGMTLEQLTKYILDRAFAQIPRRTGYMRVLCNLEVGQNKIVAHKLKDFPVVDVYQLDYFNAICAKGENAADNNVEWVLFYLYHADEKRLRMPQSTDAVEIETDPKFRMLWKTLIDELKDQKLLDYSDTTTLDDLEVDFWKAMFGTPNDEFDPDAYCHSPWFEKCCGERRTVADLTKRGDFDDIYLKMVPRKTINLTIVGPANPEDPTPEPSQVLVSQLDQDTVALSLLKPPVYPAKLGTNVLPNGTKILPLPADYANRLPVMMLLKV
jgi:hypothetical protein